MTAVAAVVAVTDPRWPHCGRERDRERERSGDADDRTPMCDRVRRVTAAATAGGHGFALAAPSVRPAGPTFMRPSKSDDMATRPWLPWLALAQPAPERAKCAFSTRTSVSLTKPRA